MECCLSFASAVEYAVGVELLTYWCQEMTPAGHVLQCISENTPDTTPSWKRRQVQPSAWYYRQLQAWRVYHPCLLEVSRCLIFYILNWIILWEFQPNKMGWCKYPSWLELGQPPTRLLVWLISQWRFHKSPLAACLTPQSNMNWSS